MAYDNTSTEELIKAAGRFTRIWSHWLDRIEADGYSLERAAYRDEAKRESAALWAEIHRRWGF